MFYMFYMFLHAIFIKGTLERNLKKSSFYGVLYINSQLYPLNLCLIKNEWYFLNFFG